MDSLTRRLLIIRPGYELWLVLLKTLGVDMVNTVNISPIRITFNGLLLPILGNSLLGIKWEAVLDLISFEIESSLVLASILWSCRILTNHEKVIKD